MRPRTAWLETSAIVALIALPAPARAQWGPRDRPRAPSPISSLLSEHARLQVAPSVGLVEGRSAHSGLDARVVWQRRSATGWSPLLALTFGGARTRTDRYFRSGLLGTAVFDGPRLGGWLRASAAVGSGDGPAQAFTLEAGGRAGVVRLDVRTTWLRDDPSIDSLPGGLPGSVTLADDRYTDAELSGSRELGPFRAQARLGARFGRQAAAAGRTGGSGREVPQWANATLALPLRGRTSLELSGGVQPERRELMQRGGAFAQLGVRIEVGRAEPAPDLPAASSAPTLTAEATAAGSYRLRLRVDVRSAVELKGDLTDWQPVRMQPSRRDPGVWEVVIAVAPGLYHVNLRIDGGEWIVPPGLATVPDGFGGDTGLLALR